MSSRPAKFTQADIARAIRAAPNRVVEITPDGSIRLVPENLAVPSKTLEKVEPERKIIL
jgi:hypothetical protein